MARLNDDQRELILADYHTGHYTQRELAKKYECSPRTINLLVVGKTPKHTDKVNAIVTAHTQMAEESIQEVNAVSLVVEEKTKHLKLINDNATLLAGQIPKIVKSFTVESKDAHGNKTTEYLMDAKSLKDLTDANDRLAITLKVADRHAPKIDIQQLQQNNTTPTVVHLVEDVRAND